jgi:hypothetical protein
MWYNSDYNKHKLEELKKLKGFFESCVANSDKTKAVAGHFGAGYSVFFGNAIQYNSFDIPYDAMRLIYEANKERIENELKFATVT